MTRQEIIALAQEAGCKDLDSLVPVAIDRFYHGFSRDQRLHLCSDDSLERFSALVAAAEREACAKVCENIKDHDTYGVDDFYSDIYAEAIRARGKQ